MKKALCMSGLLCSRAKPSPKNQSKFSLVEHPKTERKVYFFSLLSITILFFSITISGKADADYTMKKSIWQGNRNFKKARYETALTAYETTLAFSPDNKELNFNAAQSAYILGQYEKSINLYENSADSIEKYLNLGNAHFMLAEASLTKYYAVISLQQALQIYQDGIKRYPKNIPLKYNFEYATNRLLELLAEIEQEGGEEQQEPDSSPEEESESDEENKERMMQALENIEAEALKENQMTIAGEDEENGW